MNIEQKAITLIKEIEKRHHTPSKVMGSASFEQDLMEEKIELVKDFYQSIIDMVIDLMKSDNIMEHCAELEHVRWSKWQEYMFDCAIKSGDDNLGIRTLAFPTAQYENWCRQIETDYADLTEKEKESDREQVRPYLEFITNSLKQD